jgi:hypothetical protein
MKVKLIRDWSGAKAFTDIEVSKGTATYLKSVGIIDNSTVIEEKTTIVEKKRQTRKKKQN